MPTDYMDLSRGVGQLGETAQRISQMVAQHRFRQAVANMQMQQQQREFEETQRMNQFRQQLMQAQTGSAKAQAGAYGAREGLYGAQTQALDYETQQRQVLQQAMESALGQKRRADEEEDLFGMETSPLNLDKVAAIQSTLPNAETPVNLMRNVAQAQAMQNPNMLNMIALGTRSPVANVPSGAIPLDLTTMTPGKQTPFRPFAPGTDDPFRELVDLYGRMVKVEEGDEGYELKQQVDEQLSGLLSRLPKTGGRGAGTAPTTQGATPAQKAKLANQLSQEHPDWTREQVLQEVRRQLGE